MKLTPNVGPTTVSVQSINQTTKIWDLYSASGLKFPYFLNVSYGLDPSLNIAMIFLSKGSATELPAGLEEQKIYYIRRFYTNVYVQNSDYYKVYNTLSDARSDQNQLAPSYNPVYPKYFYVNYANKSFKIGECAEFGSDDPLEKLLCCPPNYFKDIYDTVNFSVHGADLTLKRTMGGYIPAGSYFPISTFGDYSLFGSANGPSVYFQYAYRSTYILAFYQFGRYLNEQHTLTYFLNALIENYQNSGQIGYVGLGGGTYTATPGTATSFTMTGNGGPSFVAQQLGLSFPSSIQVNFDLQSKTTLPPFCKLYMPDAYFYDATRPVTIGTIIETLTLDEDSGYYISEKKYYYKIPGRLHIRPRFYPTVESGIRFFQSNQTCIEVDINAPNFLSYDQFSDPLQGTANFRFEMFYADQHEGYPTGLTQGSVWFDTRRANNLINFNPPATPMPFVVGYSKSVPGPYEGSVTGNGNVYKTQYWGIRSDHPGCYVSSLEV